MKKKTAKILIELLLQQCAQQNEILKVLRSTEPDDEFRKIRTMIGQSMGHIYSEALVPIFREHPELEPEHLRYMGGTKGRE